VKKAFLPVTFFFLTFVCAAQICRAGAQEFKTGEIQDAIVCRESPGQSYALYLPSDYSPDRTWPVLYALDPGARGRLPLEHFRDAAEKYHYLVVGSNNARNGPWEPIINAVVAIWNDTRARLSIDRKRIYAAGFSGGSRAAALFSKIIRNPVAGIIGCGAGLPPGIKPEDIGPAFYFGVVGREDFNYLEMMNLDTQFREAGAPHRVLVFEGSHDWPPPEICTRAVAWMEFAAMTQDLRPTDDELIREIYASELAAAQALEAAGNLLGAVSEYETLASAFGAGYDTGRLKDRIARLKESHEYAPAAKEEKRRRESERSFLDQFGLISTQIKEAPATLLNLNKVFAVLGLDGLKKTALDTERKDKDERAMALRLLYGLEVEMRNTGWGYLDKGDSRRAGLCFEIAIKANAQVPARLRYHYFGLACSYALDKNSKKTLENLRLAVENGFDSSEAVNREKLFEFIRNTPEFQNLIRAMKGGQE
jgi:hypothetical protein